MPQIHLEPTKSTGQSFDERLCSRCMGHRALCGVSPCPLVMRAKAIFNIDQAVNGLNLAGSSPPAVFVGSYRYPKVLAGPLIPPIRGEETALMERPDLWLDKTLDQILAYRFSLVRTKRFLPVDAAVNPPRLLAETQALALSDAPTTSEAVLVKRPSFATVLTGRTLPVGPSAPLSFFKLEDNPHVSKPVDRISSDTDLKAGDAVLELFQEGIRQEHVTRLMSIGLLGLRKTRRLVPTQWSITAVDDIVGRRLHKQVLRFPVQNDFWVYADHALGNTVVLLLLPTAWQFEALECWLGGPNPPVMSDYEWFKGRKDYAQSIVGAYYATRLPALEYLSDARKQAGVLVFMEVDPSKWVPLGVWRFREIARRALASPPRKFSTLDEAVGEIGRHLTNPVQRWLSASNIYSEMASQTKLTDFG